MSRLARACIAFALCLMTVRASAHAPLPRAVAASPDGVGVALTLPGFGLLLRTAANPSFVYACDALLGIPPSDSPALVQYFADGSWLLGSSGGLHAFDADGCEHGPAHVTLGRAPVTAIAIHAASQVAYAVVSGLGDGLWRSDDRGAQWQYVAAVAGSDRVTALLIDPVDPTRLYASRDDTTLLVSSDAGASFQAFPQERALQLLAVQAPMRLWAVARALDNRGNRGFELLRSEGPGEPWHSQLRVNYFGGLTITDNGEIWVGDEGGGVYRSLDQGDSFAAVEAPRSVSCLASAGNAVWACTPDLPAAPALSALDAAQTSFQPLVALADVETQVMCARQGHSSDPCQAAWIEWQRDVLGRVPLLPGAADAGSAAAETDTSPAPGDAGKPELTTPASCSPVGPQDGSSAAWLWALVLGGVARIRRRLLAR